MIGDLCSYVVAACWLGVAMWHTSDGTRDLESDYVRRCRGAYVKAVKRAPARGM
jgi:hypothetical protein